MKNAVLMMVCGFLGVLTLLIVMTIAGRSNRSMELKSNASSIVEETLEDMMQEGIEGSVDSRSFMAELVENLAVAIDSDGDVTVDVMQMDMEKGILAVRITEQFQYPNGKTGTVETEKIVIQNRKETAEE